MGKTKKKPRGEAVSLTAALDKVADNAAARVVGGRVAPQKDVKAAEAPGLEADTLRGDIRDAILDRIRNLQKPWQQMSESEQRALVEGVEGTARHLINTTVRMVQRDGRQTVDAKLEQVTIKDKVKATLICSKGHDDLSALVEAQGMTVLLVTNPAEKFMGEKGPAAIDKDQPVLELEGEQPVKRAGKEPHFDEEDDIPEEEEDDNA